MTWIKICGITSLEDAQVAGEAGADAIGFVFYERSPRNVDPEKVREITGALAADVETVGVFVDESPLQMVEIARNAGLKAIQSHQTGLFKGGATSRPEGKQGWTGVCAGDLKMYWVLPAAGIRWVPSGRRSSISGIFLDSGSADQPGGTGKTFDWDTAKSLVEQVSQDVNVIIAGGLSPDNVSEAIRKLQPWGVDVSSGVEAKPGKKDLSKVRAFIQAVREADRAA